MGAEAAEVEADRALDAARARVRDAKEHVKRLEEEAREEARRAKIKQHQARAVSKRGEGLGRKWAGIRSGAACANSLSRPWLRIRRVVNHQYNAYEEFVEVENDGARFYRL